MKSIRQLDITTKIYASFAAATVTGLLLACWLLVQLGQTAELAGQLAHQGAAATAQVVADASVVRNWAIAFLVLDAAAATLLGLWIAAEVRRPVRQAVELARRLASGELDRKDAAEPVPGGSPLLASLHEMNGKLAAMMRDLRSGSEQIVRDAADVAAGSKELSSRTGQQAASLEATASSMEELTATVKQNADHAHQASKLAVSASEVAVKGGAVVSEVVGTMASINESSKRIAEIIGVIDGIAFQTNILALNAAVEAARAGEQGRGFAVVASEVRCLAQRSAAAAKEIKELIDDSVEKVNAGTQLADKAGHTMNEVVSSVKRVTDIIGEIADASAEQTTGIDQVNQAIAAMDQATQQNAALVQQSATAAASMREQADHLTRMVGTFAREPRTAPAREARQSPPTPPRPTVPPRPQAAPASSVRPAAGPRSGHAPSPVPRRARGGAQGAPLPDTSWEEF
jgi:methyl-accepting chemotaxis protein